MLQRRSLFSFLAAIPVLGFLAPKAKAEPVAPLTGLAARRQEAIRIFTTGLDQCIKAEQEFYPGKEPERLFLTILATYGGKQMIMSKPVASFLPNEASGISTSARDAEGQWVPE